MGNVLKKVAWVGRTASMVFGLALVLALVVGVSTTALAGTGVGARFDLGKTNTVNVITKLVGSVAGPSLQIDNNSTNSAATALDLQVEAGRVPMTVNSAAKVTNLNSDKLDGKDSSQFQQVSAPAPQALSLINGWRKEVENDPNTPAYYKDAEGLVHLEGAIECESGASGCAINHFATLPAGFRPNHTLFVPNAVQGRAIGTIRISSDGSLRAIDEAGLSDSVKSYAGLEGVTFRAVQ